MDSLACQWRWCTYNTHYYHIAIFVCLFQSYNLPWVPCPSSSALFSYDCLSDEWVVCAPRILRLSILWFPYFKNSSSGFTNITYCSWSLWSFYHFSDKFNFHHHCHRHFLLKNCGFLFWFDCKTWELVNFGSSASNLLSLWHSKGSQLASSPISLSYLGVMWIGSSTALSCLHRLLLSPNKLRVKLLFNWLNLFMVFLMGLLVSFPFNLFKVFPGHLKMSSFPWLFLCTTFFYQYHPCHLGFASL